MGRLARRETVGQRAPCGLGEGFLRCNAGMPFGGVGFLCQIPQTPEPVSTYGQEVPSIRSELDEPDRQLMFEKRPYRLARERVPYSRRLIGTGCGHPPSVRAERGVTHMQCMSQRRSEWRAGDQVPDPCFAVDSVLARCNQ